MFKFARDGWMLTKGVTEVVQSCDCFLPERHAETVQGILELARDLKLPTTSSATPSGCITSLSLRDVELILAERGIVVTHESIRHWCLKFGADFARRLRRRRDARYRRAAVDEVFIRIRGVLHYLWRAVDQHGVVLDILVQDRRNGTAAKRFFKRLPAWATIQTAAARHRWPAQLWRRSASDPARCASSNEPVLEQSCGEFASPHTTTRATDAEVQIVRSGPAISVDARHDLRSFQATTPPYARR